MHSQLIESMRDRVRTIYRIATGNEVPDSKATDEQPEIAPEEVQRAFAELEALARATPGLAGRIAPFSFTPALDAFFQSDELVVEVAVPGVEREHVAVECVDETLFISGIRRGQAAGDVTNYAHAEIPCGPFCRTFHVPFRAHDEPAVELDRGLLRVRLKKSVDHPHEEETRVEHTSTE